MATILIHSDGTLGDHLPCIALACALRGRGHRVRLAVNRAMHPWAERSGIEAVALTDIERGEEEARRNARAWNHWEGGTGVAPLNGPLPPRDWLVRQSLELAQLCRGADLLIATAIRVQGRIAREISGVPWLTLSLNPATFATPGSPGEAVAGHLASVRQFHGLREQVAAAYRAAGVVRPLPDWSMTWHCARHILLASSVHFSRSDPALVEPRHSLDLTGFWHYEDPSWESWRPDPGLEEFMARRPVVLAFSSQPLEDPGRVLAAHAEAAAALGLPLLVQRGWAGFGPEQLPPGIDRSSVRFEGFLPQDWLFARAACAVQHGGIGSIARALRNGCPLLIAPFGNDQMYNARRVRDLGVGTAIHPFRTDASGIARALRERVLTAECRARAERLGQRLAVERGEEEACRLIEAFLAAPAEDEGRPVWRVPALRELASPRRVPPGAGEGEAAPAAPAGAIPRVVHQTWKDAAVPEELAAWRRSWLEHNPGWELRLWTDEDCRDLIRRDYPSFLAVFDGYPQAIMRADAARTFILHRHGGVYADLDVECLRPLAPLLEGRQIVLGVEPERHRLRHFPLPGGPRWLVCNAFMASVPGHPFWEHVHRALAGACGESAVLDATGPILLARACESWRRRGDLSLEPPPLLYPITADEAWDGLTPEVRGLMAATAFTVHHWRGSWWSPAELRPQEDVTVEIVDAGNASGLAWEGLSRLEAAAGALDPQPLVSCLMVTRGRAELARRAVSCFLRQTWRERELVIVDDGPDEGLADWVRGLDDRRVRIVRLPDEGLALGELRNRAVAAAYGAYLAQWDDDDLSDPSRLAVELGAIAAAGADAALLARHTLWQPARRRLGLSTHRPWEGSLVVRREALPPYPPLRRGEDTPVVERIARERRLVALDAPWLYAYVSHGGNTFGDDHFERHWHAATAVCPAGRYEEETAAMLLRMGGPA